MTMTSAKTKRPQTSVQALFLVALLGVSGSAAAISFAPKSDLEPPLPVERVNFEFQNTLHENAMSPATAITVFSGSVGPYKAPASSASTTATIPTGTNGSTVPISLVESGMGTPLAGDVPYGGFVDDTIRRAQRLLYWRADNTADDNDKAAFRYLVKLYGPDTGSAGTTGRLARSAAAGSEDAQAALEQRLEIRHEADEALRALAAHEVPTIEEMVSNLPDETDLTQEQFAVIQHNREALLKRVEFAQRELESMEFAETRRHQGRDVTSNIRCNFENIATYYGDAERARVDEALTVLRQAMKYAPLNSKLANAYLDVFYDRCVAELQFIKVAKVERAQYRLGLQAVPGNGFVIDMEIEILRDQILPNYQAALSGLGEMLSERGGVDVSTIDGNVPPSTPLGCYIFQREQFQRNKHAARYVDGMNNIHTVLPSDPSGPEISLFDGYKDYVMMLSIWSDYLTDAADLARLYGMRNINNGTINDKQAALDLIQEVQQATTIDVKLLEAMFADFKPAPGDAAGVYAARQGIFTGLGEFERVKSFLEGTANALGYDPDFLVLIQESPDTTQGNQFDSYDSLAAWIRHTNTSVYNFAETTFMAAMARYDDFRASNDELYEQLSDIETEFGDRYFEIVGTDDPDNTDININTPAQGSELYQVRQTIQSLKDKSNDLAKFGTELKVAISESTVYKTNTVPSKGARVDGLLTTYKNSVSSEFDTITEWTAKSAGSQAAYDTLTDAINTAASSSQTPWGAAAGGAGAAIITAAGVVNTAMQITAAHKEGDAQKNIDSAQATFDAGLVLNDLDSDLHGAAQELSTLRREQISHAIESAGLISEAAQTRAQEIALLREVTFILQKRQENATALSDRYFADPLHQVRAQSTQLRADCAFREAQRWVFFTQRALEYKWNKPFAMMGYDSGSIMKLRNFQELEGLLVAIENFNTTNLVGFNRESFVDALSLKNDFFGYKDGTTYDMTDNDGTSVTVSADEAFRRRLIQFVDPQTGLLDIPLNTFSLSKASGVFFAGPEYDNTGRISSAGKYLDKIEWIKFKIVGNATPQVITGNYSYGGASYIRTRMPPCADPEDDRTLADEFTRFPFNYFRTLDNGATWQQRPTQEDTVKIAMSQSSGEPIDSAENPQYRNTFLKERSVAATQQQLKISVSKLEEHLSISTIKDIEIYVRHQFVSREMPVCN